jgi:NAD(P)-dependent dehydrogenase (short-subunit alcohol dehydrogenase family)
MSGKQQRVAIITGGSQGIGAGLVAAYRRPGWAVVANSRTIKPSGDRDVLAVDGDVSEPATTDRWPGDSGKGACSTSLYSFLFGAFRSFGVSM